MLEQLQCRNQLKGEISFAYRHCEALFLLQCWSAVATKPAVLPRYHSMTHSKSFCWNILFHQSQNIFTFINLFTKGNMNKTGLTRSNPGWHIMPRIRQEFQHLPELKSISKTPGYNHTHIHFYFAWALFFTWKHCHLQQALEISQFHRVGTDISGIH